MKKMWSKMTKAQQKAELKRSEKATIKMLKGRIARGEVKIEDVSREDSVSEKRAAARKFEREQAF